MCARRPVKHGSEIVGQTDGPFFLASSYQQTFPRCATRNPSSNSWWVTFLPAEERGIFVDEVVRTAEGAAELGSMAALAQVLIE